MPLFRLLHASDIHATSVPCVFGPGRSHQQILARFIARNASDFDAVLISGDLSNSGMRKDMRASHEYLLSPGRPTQSGNRRHFTNRRGQLTLNSTPRPIWIMPGNHDRYRRFSYGRPGGVEFDTIFRSHWHYGPGGVQAFQVNLAPDLRMSFIAADFSLRRVSDAVGINTSPAATYAAAIGQGRVYDTGPNDTLQLLKDLTDDERRHDHTIVVWIAHFPPDNGVNQREPDLGLIDTNKLTSAANSMHVPLILSGHLHEYFDTSFPSASQTARPRVWAATTPCASWLGRVTGEFGFHILEFDVTALRNRSGVRTVTIDVERRNFRIFPRLHPRVQEGPRFRNGLAPPGVSWTE